MPKIYVAFMELVKCTYINPGSLTVIQLEKLRDANESMTVLIASHAVAC